MQASQSFLKDSTFQQENKGEKKKEYLQSIKLCVKVNTKPGALRVSALKWLIAQQRR